jgi:hypothetical protein
MNERNDLAEYLEKQLMNPTKETGNSSVLPIYLPTVKRALPLSERVNEYYRQNALHLSAEL